MSQATAIPTDLDILHVHFILSVAEAFSCMYDGCSTITSLRRVNADGKTLINY